MIDRFSDPPVAVGTASARVEGRGAHGWGRGAPGRKGPPGGRSLRRSRGAATRARGDGAGVRGWRHSRAPNFGERDACADYGAKRHSRSVARAEGDGV